MKTKERKRVGWDVVEGVFWSAVKAANAKELAVLLSFHSYLDRHRLSLQTLTTNSQALLYTFITCEEPLLRRQTGSSSIMTATFFFPLLPFFYFNIHNNKLSYQSIILNLEHSHPLMYNNIECKFCAFISQICVNLYCCCMITVGYFYPASCLH